MTAFRYAIYVAPDPESALWKQGSSWLGRDAARGGTAPRPADTGLDASRADEIMAGPARRWFHATPQPPFRLAGGETAERLCALAAAFDHFRAASDAIELSRRSRATLTGSLREPERAETYRALADYFAGTASAPVVNDSISIFEQGAGGGFFRIRERFALTGGDKTG